MKIEQAVKIEPMSPTKIKSESAPGEFSPAKVKAEPAMSPVKVKLEKARDDSEDDMPLVSSSKYFSL